MTKRGWDKIGRKKRSGVVVPLFSVYSSESTGIGDFDDLKTLVDWCVRCGYSILQLLPMNDVGALFCPYDSLSSFALSPMYVSLKNVRTSAKKTLKARISEIKKEMPSGKPHIDYAIKDRKIRALLDVFMEDEAARADPEFERFIKDNEYWLEDFALYKSLKDCHKLMPWYEWNDGYKNRSSSILDEFVKDHNDEITFYKWMQWQAYLQFKSAREYAASKGVLIKGDLPILVSRDSADVWAHRECFKLEFAAGAPPDLYCHKGQRWGMPTYNWQHIESEGYSYVKEKLKFAENFYDILRIDHVVGLFRIWSIPYNEPPDNQGLNGFFDPADENTWGERGRKLLSFLKENTSMLLCAEDLGMIPKVCPDTLKEMEIPGNDVQRWMKDWVNKHDFLAGSHYRKFAVAMLSTHDTTNFAAWWENEAGTIDEGLFMRRSAQRGIDFAAVREKLFDPARSGHGRLRWREEIKSARILADTVRKPAGEIGDIIDNYNNTYREKEKLWRHLKLEGEMREKCDGEILRRALEAALDSECVFCIELIFDLMMLADVCAGDPYQYRINFPGTVNPANWSLTLPVPLEKLMKLDINKELHALVKSSGRL